MNIILFRQDETEKPFARSDPRVRHILEVLRREIGDTTDCGLIDGPRGKAILNSMDKDSVSFEFVWGEEPEALLPIDLIVGLSRPQTSRKILQEATSMGVRSIRFVTTDRGEPSYGTSKLWSTDEWKRLVRAGVEQAFTTRFPEVLMGVSLSEAMNGTPSDSLRICMDNYEAKCGLAAIANGAGAVTLAVGSERGWSAAERDLFRESGFALAHLGERPLRTETATIASIGIVSALLGNS